MVYSYEQFKIEFFRMTDIELDSYKEKQMKRRIDSLMSTKGYSDYFHFVRALKDNEELLQEFIEYITINVSEFYRNPEQWDYFEKEILPKYLAKERIKIWSAGCSTGDEPYTIAMILLKYRKKSEFGIIATDIDEKAIRMAKAGEYGDKSIAHLPAEYRSYFTKDEKGKNLISSDLKRLVTFQKQNLFKDPYPRNVDLLVCRNALIYFTEEKKEEIFVQFHKSLNPGGILFLGNTEQMINYRETGFERIAPFFYLKK